MLALKIVQASAYATRTATKTIIGARWLVGTAIKFSMSITFKASDAFRAHMCMRICYFNIQYYCTV